MNITVIDLWGHPVTLLYAVIVGAGEFLTTSKAKPKGRRKTQNRTSALDVRLIPITKFRVNFESRVLREFREIRPRPGVFLAARAFCSSPMFASRLKSSPRFPTNLIPKVG